MRTVPYISIVIAVLPLILVLGIMGHILLALTVLLLVAAGILAFRGRISNGPPTKMEVLYSIFASAAVTLVLLPILLLFNGGGIPEAWADPDVREAILVSMWAGTLSTLLSLVLAVPTAYILARKSFPGRSVVEGVLDLPVVVPHTVAGIALLLVFGMAGDNSTLSLSDSLWGIVAAMMFVSLPFVLNQVKEGIRAVDPRMEKVAMSLGSTQTGAFFRVVLPQTVPSIISGSLMAFARAVSEFGAVVIIAYYPMTAPVLIYQRFTSFGVAASRPIAALFMLLTGLVFVALRAVSTRTGVRRT